MDRIKFTIDGLYISKPGKSTDSTNINDFVFHPNQNSMSVVGNGGGR